MLAFAVSVSTLSQGQPKPGLEMKKNDLFKWMDEIGFPSADGSKFFEITLPTPKTCGDRSIILHGFLICKSPGMRVYFTDDARDFILNGNEVLNTTIREIDFSQYVEQVLISENPYLESSVNGYCIEMGHRCGLGRYSLNLFPAMRDIILSRWCAQRGENDAGHRLWIRALGTMPKLAYAPVEEQFKEIFPAILLDRAIASMANPATRRAECIARLDWIGATWEGSECGELATKLRDDLEASMKIQLDLDMELNRDVKMPRTPDQLVRQLIDQEFWGGDIRTGFGPFEGTGGVSPFSEILRQSDLTRNILTAYVDSDAPTRLVSFRNTELPRMQWETLGTVARGLLDLIELKETDPM